MLYRPNFCCSCGEKIERAEWPIWVSRRFCDLCASEHKLGDLAPRAILIGCLVFGLAGAFAFVRQPGQKPIIDDISRSAAAKQPLNAPAAANLNTTSVQLLQSQPVPNADLPTVDTEKRAAARAPEVVYYCGAMTKKGTPCSRRVKSNERCWQHAGLPAVSEPATRRVLNVR
jgi:hypothetical protein